MASTHAATAATTAAAMAATTAATGPRMSEGSLVRRLAASLAAGFVILASVVVAAGWLLLRAQDFNFWVDHTYTVEAQAAEFRVLLEQAEAARRAYLISGDALHQTLYDRAARGLAPVVGDLSLAP